ncbi:TMEM198/TM7SF3 family protein [Christensenellaceae bacterium OttesenSCG-928-K19]|nr:TMEM198/TM7SF3 family protein [Christensenellaceae bacterium OttesenSCG-928-K19]
MNSFLPVLLLVLLLVLGIIYCFWGYKYLKVMIMLYALFAGGSFMFNLLSESAPDLGNGIWVISIAVGLVLGLLAFFFVKFCIFLAGGILGIAIFNLVKGANPAYFASLDSIYVFLIGLACFIILGVITLAAKKHLIIIVTAVFGAYSMVYVAGILIGLIGSPQSAASASVTTAVTQLAPVSVWNSAPSWAMMLPVAVLAIIGIFVQYKRTARGKKY